MNAHFPQPDAIVTIIAALIVAAGRGIRAQSPDGVPKQYAGAGGVPLLTHSLRAFAACPAITHIQVVTSPEHGVLYRAAAQAAGCGAKLAPSVPGGESRQASVRAGLAALSGAGVDRVLIHDAARPFVDPDTIAAVIAALDRAPGAIAAEPLADTLKRAGPGNRIAETLSREGLWRAQTPQGFHFAAILGAHDKAVAAGIDTFTDDAALAEWAGLDVVLVPSPGRNSKVTTADDLATAGRLLGEREAPMEPRTATGFDVHRFKDGDHVWLCGVRIPHDHGVEGHSDADVALHALTDAILGALGDGDIGQHFPPSDPRWKGAPSHLFLADAARRAAERGARIANADLTILAEAPRIGPYRDEMRQTVARILAIDVTRVGLKATTTEGLGFTGRREGLAAMATVTLLFP